MTRGSASHEAMAAARGGEERGATRTAVAVQVRSEEGVRQGRGGKTRRRLGLGGREE